MSIAASPTRNYYRDIKEWPYKNEKPKIIIEQYTEPAGGQRLMDIQLWRLSGNTGFISQIESPRGENNETPFDTDRSILPFASSQPTLGDIPGKPESLAAILDATYKITQLRGLPSVRVGFLAFGNQAKFSELTLYPASGFVRWRPHEYNMRMGKLIHHSYTA